MNYEKVNKLLEKNRFFGFTVSRNGSRLTYNYRSISYYAVEISVEVIRVNPETFGCKKLVASVVISGKVINDHRELLECLKTIYKVQNEEQKKLYRKV